MTNHPLENDNSNDLQLPPGTVMETLPTLLVTREFGEHANVFHTLTDLLNVYVTLRTLGWEAEQRQVRHVGAGGREGWTVAWWAWEGRPQQSCARSVAQSS